MTAPTSGAAGTFGGNATGGGSGEQSSAGAGGSDGQVVPVVPVVLPSAGCGKDPEPLTGEWQQYSIPLAGETLGEPHAFSEREIMVRLPADYDSNKPYRVVYAPILCGYAQDYVKGAYPLWDADQGGDPNAIYVLLENADSSILGCCCYDTRSGLDSVEWESFDRDHAFVSERFCVDNHRVYVGGYGAGYLSLPDMYGCYFAGIPEPPRKFLPDVALRAAMSVVSGGDFDHYPTCNGPVGRFFIDDTTASFPASIELAEEARDRALAENGCTDGPNGPTEVWGADFLQDGECLKYTACPAAYPVVFCTTNGQHVGWQPDNAVPGFTRFMAEIEAAAP